MRPIRYGRVLERRSGWSGFGPTGIRTFLGSTSSWSDAKDGQGKEGQGKELPTSTEEALTQAFWKVWKKKVAEKEGVQRKPESLKPPALETKQDEVKVEKSEFKESKKSEDHKSLEGRKAAAKQGWALVIQRLQKKHQENPEMKARLEKTKNILRQLEEEALKKAEQRRRSRETSEEYLRMETQRIMEIVKKIHDPKNKL